jgi:hypothetical protein
VTPEPAIPLPIDQRNRVPVDPAELFEGGFILCRALENRSAMHDQLRIFRQLVEALLLTHRVGVCDTRRA